MKLNFRESKLRKDWLVFNNHEEYLGKIFYYPKWECYVWCQDDETIMSSDCLQQIVDKLRKLNQE